MVDYRDATGIRHWITCPTREQAEQVRAERVRDSVQARPTPANPHITFKEYADAWLTRVKPDLARSTGRGYSAILTHHLQPAFGLFKVRALHLGHIKALLAEKRAAGYSRNMLRLMRATLSVILGDAVEDGLINLNPVSQLARRRRSQAGAVTPADRQHTIRPLAPEELMAALAATDKTDRRAYPYLLTLARAGLRPSEGLALQWNDLAFKSRELRVERSLDATGRVVPTKTGLTRTVDMSVGLATGLQRLRSERAAETLKRGWPEVPAWVFCSEAGTPLDLSNVTKAWRRVLKAAKLPSFRLYDLRHTFATELLAQGAPITYVAAQLGHTKPTTTLQWYAHWLPRGDKHWVDALDSAGAKTRGDQLVTNRAVGAGGVVEVIEKLEPTIGLEPMTCRLRIDCSTN
jgi:integrase